MYLAGCGTIVPLQYKSKRKKGPCTQKKQGGQQADPCHTRGDLPCCHDQKRPAGRAFMRPAHLSGRRAGIFSLPPHTISSIWQKQFQSNSLHPHISAAGRGRHTGQARRFGHLWAGQLQSGDIVPAGRPIHSQIPCYYFKKFQSKCQGVFCLFYEQRPENVKSRPQGLGIGWLICEEFLNFLFAVSTILHFHQFEKPFFAFFMLFCVFTKFTQWLLCIMIPHNEK